MTARLAFLAAALAAWVAGSALGTPPSPHASATGLSIGRAGEASHLPALSSSEPIFILALGSDARPGEVVERQRADSIHLIGINPERRRATIVGFPRDAWVEIPGHGTNKINNAMTMGGPPLVVETVESLTGVEIDYYALTSFSGLIGMINAVGGVQVDVPYDISDGYARAYLEEGVQRLTGAQVLQFSRARHDVPNGDFSRSQNQGRVFLGALAQFRTEFAKDPGRLLEWAAAGLRNLKTDLSIQEALALAFTAVEIRKTDVRNIVVPGTIGTVEGLSVVLLSKPAESLFADLRDDGVVG